MVVRCRCSSGGLCPHDSTEFGYGHIRAWNIRNFRTREFYTGLEEIGVQDPHRYVPYSCRHTFASLAAKANVDKEALQRAIGHQIGSSVTDDYYISQDAHISAAQEEFEKMANEIKCIIDAT